MTIQSHIDEQGNKFYTRKELESYEETFLSSFMEEITLFTRLFDLFVNTLKKLGIDGDMNENEISDEIQDYIYNNIKKLADMRSEIIDVYYIDVIIPEEEVNDIVNSKIENIDDININLESIITNMEKLMNNNK